MDQRGAGKRFSQHFEASLDFHLSTNRCPFFIGTHSDYYAENNDYFERLTASDCAERRKSIADFINYALSKPDVRIVRFVDMITWMKNPVALDAASRIDATEERPVAMHQVRILPGKRPGLFFPAAGIYSVGLYSLDGRKIVAESRAFTAGVHPVNHCLPSVPPGVYTIRINESGIRKFWLRYGVIE
jgi:hypothetical protein